MSDAMPTRDEFAALLEESLGGADGFEGRVVKGRVTGVENDMAIVDIGLKAEGRVALKEFTRHGEAGVPAVGDEVDVYIERIENAAGEAVVSRDKARREEAWDKLEAAVEKDGRVDGVIFGRVKGGFTVDLSGAVAFLPGSQVDVRPVRDVGPLMGMPQPFQVLKLDRKRGNIVVSRRAILEETRAEQRSEILDNLKEGQTVEGLGMKQLQADPWDAVAAKYPIGATFSGRVTNITDYGAFVELEPGVEGLVHISEMSWTKKNVHPGKIVSTSQEVEVKVLEVDPDKRRISLGLKQTQENPWVAFADRHKAGTVVEGEVKNITEFGVFIGLEGDIDGMVHMSDIEWGKSGEEAMARFHKGERVKAVVLDVDTDKERVSLGVKQLAGDPMVAVASKKRGDQVTGTVVEVNDGGIEVQLGDDGPRAFIRRGDLSRDRAEQRPERFAKGDKVDAMITNIDASGQKIGLSIKALEIAEEKAAVAQYGSSDSGASLGDILGAALKAKEDEQIKED